MADDNRLLIGIGTRIRRADDLLATEVEGEVIMMDPTKGLYFGLDPIGTDIWRRLEVPITVSDLIAALAHDYEAPVEEIERDVLALLVRLAEHGLVSEC